MGPYGLSVEGTKDEVKRPEAIGLLLELEVRALRAPGLSVIIHIKIFILKKHSECSAAFD